MFSTLVKITAAAATLAATTQAGWITFTNENKQAEGLPCVGAIYGNDNFLVSTFDCGATDWNSSFCGIHCFPFSATTCIGKVPLDVNNGTGNGLWYAPHSVQTACQFLGPVESPQHDYPQAGVNVTSCGYVDWPESRTWGPTRALPPYDVKTSGCWNVTQKPDPKYPKKNGIHYFDGAAPTNQSFCDQMVAQTCDGGNDPICKYNPSNDLRIDCKKTEMPKTSKE